jgi:acetyl esterase
MMDPQLQAFLDDWAKHWADMPQPGSPAVRRAHFEVVAQRMREPWPEGVTGDEQHRIAVPASRGGAVREVRVRVYRPARSTVAAPLPALIYMHGGAWMQGSPETHADITAGLAAAAHAVVISVNYALAPEQPFPCAFDDCCAVARWAHANATTLGLRPNAIAIGGDSSGGNLAAATALALRGSDVAFRAQLLIYPAVDFSLDRASHRDNAHGPVITVASMPAVNAMYCPDAADLKNPMAAPLLAASHAGLPPAYVAVAEHDPLRDEGIAYAEALHAAGVAVTLDRGESLIHGYLRAKAYCDRSRDSFARMGAWLKAVLHPGG